MTIQLNSSTPKHYKTPLKKLTTFFINSRDKWKERSKIKQVRIDDFEVKVRDLTKSRDNWKKKYKEIKISSKKTLVETKNNKSLAIIHDTKTDSDLETLEGEFLPKEQSKIDPFSKPFAHNYSFSTIQLGMEMVLFAHTSFRGAMKCFELFGKYHTVETPTWVTIENWILRFGLYELQKNKEKRDDWIFILDHTVQAGTQKCLVILGVTLEQICQNGFNLSHQAPQVLKIIIDDHSNGDMIHDYLKKLSQEVGVPIQIISDHGSDIKKGVDLFCKDNSTVCYTYDITHEVGILLKNLLGKNEDWKAFTTWCGNVRKKILQTNLGFLAPPGQRTKARFLNLAPLIRWANNLLLYSERGNFNLIDSTFHIDQETLMELISESSIAEKLIPLSGKIYKTPKDFLNAIEDKVGAESVVYIQEILLNHAKIGKQRFDEYFSGLDKFKHLFPEYLEIINVIQLAEKQVKNEGLSNKSANELKKKAKALKLSYSKSNELLQGIIHYLENEGKSIPEGSNWLCASDIIESVFGKYKLFSSKTKLQGISKLILAIPAFVTELTIDELKQALEMIRSIDVKEWIDENLGQSIIGKRMAAFK